MILPTYDEATTIREVLAGVLALPGVDALVVDDSSPDGTGDIVRELMTGEPRLRLVERPARSGLASAYLEGFGRALDEGYDLIVEMDSDLSHDPAQLASLLDAARDRFDLVVGSRYVPGGSVTNWSRARLALSKARQQLRPRDARDPPPRRHERLPRLSARSAPGPGRRSRSTPTATASRSSS